jgi:hypothetical protein
MSTDTHKHTHTCRHIHTPAAKQLSQDAADGPHVYRHTHTYTFTFTHTFTHTLFLQTHTCGQAALTGCSRRTSNVYRHTQTYTHSHADTLTRRHTHTQTLTRRYTHTPAAKQLCQDAADRPHVYRHTFTHLRPSSSARMQPTDHMSIAAV